MVFFNLQNVFKLKSSALVILTRMINKSRKNKETWSTQSVVFRNVLVSSQTQSIPKKSIRAWRDLGVFPSSTSVFLVIAGVWSRNGLRLDVLLPPVSCGVFARLRGLQSAVSFRRGTGWVSGPQLPWKLSSKRKSCKTTTKATKVAFMF